MMQARMTELDERRPGNGMLKKDKMQFYSCSNLEGAVLVNYV